MIGVLLALALRVLSAALALRLLLLVTFILLPPLQLRARTAPSVSFGWLWASLGVLNRTAFTQPWSASPGWPSTSQILLLTSSPTCCTRQHTRSQTHTCRPPGACAQSTQPDCFTSPAALGHVDLIIPLLQLRARTAPSVSFGLLWASLGVPGRTACTRPWSVAPRWPSTTRALLLASTQTRSTWQPTRCQTHTRRPSGTCAQSIQRGCCTLPAAPRHAYLPTARSAPAQRRP